MKRSKMLEIIKIHLEGEFGNEDELFFGLLEHKDIPKNTPMEYTLDQIANCCLLAVESSGMLPPATKFNMGNNSIMDNFWEPEED